MKKPGRPKEISRSVDMTVRLPEKSARLLRRWADQQGVSASAVIRTAIARYIRERRS